MNTAIGSNGDAARRAIVVGASIAGLLAARVLRGRFDEVVLLERDALPENAAPRAGTPQAVHPHALLARGRQAIEELLPGITAALAAAGGQPWEVGRDDAMLVEHGGLARCETGLTALAVSRSALEAGIRRRVRALPGVRLLAGADVLSPLHEDGRVVGVRWRGVGTNAPPQVLFAALVVDCSGRGSRSPAWLREWGYDAPIEERVAIASRAPGIGAHDIAALAGDGEPLFPGMRHGLPHSQRRRYERLRRFPDGYLVMGDALASLDPAWRQGMTVAASEALVLRDALAGTGEALAQRYFRATARIVASAWVQAVASEPALSQVQGPRPLPVRLVAARIARVRRAAVHDPVAAAALLKVAHLVASPSSLFAPGLLWRI